MPRSSLTLAAALLALVSLGVSPPLREALADDPTLDAVPRPAVATLEFSRFTGREDLHAEYRIPLEDGLTHQQIGRRAIEEAIAIIDRMKEAGWKLRSERPHMRGGEFDYRKGILLDATIKVHPGAHPMEGRMKHFVAFEVHIHRRMPYEDIVGCDPIDVPRYPGSVRIRYMNVTGDFATKYLVVGSAEDVTGFFAAKLPGLGWKETRGVGTLNYRKGGWEKPEDAGSLTEPKDPIDVAEEAIPTTLSLHIADREGLVEIGVGRAAGAPDKGKVVAGPITPPLPPQEPPPEVLTKIDPERDLPAYEGLACAFRQTLPITLQGEETLRLEYGKADAEMKEALAIADFYLEEMKKRGWELLVHEWHGIGRKLLFAKEAVKVRVNVNAVGRYPLPEKTPRITIPVDLDVIHPIPSRDVAGKDVKGVPRYPGSVRFFRLAAGTSEIVKFKAVGAVADVERFFIRELPKGEWIFAGNDKTGLLFVPASSAQSAAGALASGDLIPNTLKVKVDDAGLSTVKIGMDFTRGK